MRKRIFITGGAGFIGANFVKYLLDKGGFDLTVYDNLSVCTRDNLKKAIKDSKKKGKVKFVKGDILDAAKLNKSIKEHSAVVHLAAHTQVVESLKIPKKNFEINTIGTLNVLEATRMNKIKRFVFASSNAAVGEQIPPINEKMVPRPLSPYGATKLHGEALCSAYFNSYDLETVSLRFANAYGPYSEHKTSVVAKFLRRVKESKKLEIYGDGRQTRDFIHAQDISQAIFLALKACGGTCKSSPFGEVFQVATGEETKITDLSKKINSVKGSKGNVKFSPSRKGEIRKNFSDITKAKKMLKFKPQITLTQGILNLLD